MPGYGVPSGFNELGYLKARHHDRDQRPENLDVQAFAKIQFSDLIRGVKMEWVGNDNPVFQPPNTDGGAQGGRPFVVGAPARTDGTWGGGVLPIAGYDGAWWLLHDGTQLDARFSPLNDWTHSDELPPAEGAASFRWADGRYRPFGVPGIVVAGTSEYAQEAIGFAQDPLIAQHRGNNPPRYSSVIYEIMGDELDKDRRASLSSHIRIEQLHTGGWQAAWLATGAVGEPTGFAAMAFAGMNALASHEQSGPLHPGGQGCQHRLGTSPDGRQCNSGHLDRDQAYFYGNDTEDGPFRWEHFRQGGDHPIPTKCRIGFNPGVSHPHITGPKQGRYEVWTTSPIRRPYTPDVPLTPDGWIVTGGEPGEKIGDPREPVVEYDRYKHTKGENKPADPSRMPTELARPSEFGMAKPDPATQGRGQEFGGEGLTSPPIAGEEDQWPAWNRDWDLTGVPGWERPDDDVIGADARNSGGQSPLGGTPTAPTAPAPSPNRSGSNNASSSEDDEAGWEATGPVSEEARRALERRRRGARKQASEGSSVLSIAGARAGLNELKARESRIREIAALQAARRREQSRRPNWWANAALVFHDQSYGRFHDDGRWQETWAAGAMFLSPTAPGGSYYTPPEIDISAETPSAVSQCDRPFYPGVFRATNLGNATRWGSFDVSTDGNRAPVDGFYFQATGNTGVVNAQLIGVNASGTQRVFKLAAAAIVYGSHAGSNIGLGHHTETQVTGVGTNLITVGTKTQVQLMAFAAGTYEYFIDLDTSDSEGNALVARSTFNFNLNLEQNLSGLTEVTFRSGSSGTELHTITSDSGADVYKEVTAYFNGTSWILKDVHNTDIPALAVSSPE